MQRACRSVGLARASFFRLPADKAKRDAPVVDVRSPQVNRHGTRSTLHFPKVILIFI